jgi:hypothetical protein
MLKGNAAKDVREEGEDEEEAEQEAAAARKGKQIEDRKKR